MYMGPIKLARNNKLFARLCEKREYQMMFNGEISLRRRYLNLIECDLKSQMTEYLPYVDVEVDFPIRTSVECRSCRRESRVPRT